MNHGNTLYITGLSSRVTDKELKEYFSKEGKVSLLGVPTQIFLLLL
jgi:RNA recognition motif-containing protein